MEKDILSNLKTLEREGRQQLALLRKQKRANRPHREHSTIIREHLRARKSGDPAVELFLLNRLLDRDDLSPKERKSISARRRNLLRQSS